MKNYQKNILIGISVLLAGLVGGLIFQLFVFPYLLDNDYFSQLHFIRDFKDGKVIINTKEQVNIQENNALQDAIDKVGETVVGIQAVNESGIVAQGSGVIATTDGLVITLAELLPQGNAINVILNGQEVNPEIVKKDLKNNLALLRIPAQNLKTCGFCNSQEVKLGERVFLLGIAPAIYKESANEGIVKYFDDTVIKTSMIDSNFLKGSPLFNIDGNLVGLNTVDQAGKVSAIPISKIKAFAGF
jgi:S1-C subfamily serine protease